MTGVSVDFGVSMVNKGPRVVKAGACVLGVTPQGGSRLGLGSGAAPAVTLELGVCRFLSFFICFALLEASRLSTACLL